MFVNGRWYEKGDGSISVEEGLLRRDGEGMQGHHYAFLESSEFGNFEASFQFRLKPHSDIGMIFRAQDPSHFHLLHFPDCGQASRAQHFWAAVSKMDERGYLTILRMQLLQRVSSLSGVWLEADLRFRGKTVTAVVEGRARFSFRLEQVPPRGAVGLYLFGPSQIRNVVLRGIPRTAETWCPSPLPKRNWFHPKPERGPDIWQRPRELLQTGDGLLLHYEQIHRGKTGKPSSLLVRSPDLGRTWSEPEPLDPGRPGSLHLHKFPDGGLRLIIADEDGFFISESEDDGRTWSRPARMKVHRTPREIERLHIGPQGFLNLRDGSVLMFCYGRHASTKTDSSIFTWGSHHCQAFSSRSEDNGHTWSDWTNMDGTRDPEGRAVTGNLDLTEVSSVQTTSGSVLALIRPIYSPWMWETWSSDAGETWEACRRGPFPGYAAANMLRTRSGVVLISHRLPGCTIHASRDDGASWDEGTMIDSAIWTMGSMVEVKKDQVLYVYWDSFESLMRAQIFAVGSKGLKPREL